MNSSRSPVRRVAILTALVSCILAPAVHGANITYWSPATGGNGHFYETVYVTNGISWADAQAAATNAGGYLCTLTSAEENLLVARLIQRDRRLLIPVDDTMRGPWIGGFQPLHSPEPDGGWMWVTGEPWSFTAWSPGEPNNSFGTENSLHFYSRPASTWLTNWNDLDGTILLNGYVVEFDNPPADIRCSQVEISWPSVSGLFYRVEYESAATTNLWRTVPGANAIRGSGQVQRIRVPIPANQPEPSFRVVLVPR